MLFLDKTIPLSDIDLIIYKYVLQHMDKVVLMRIRELAAATHTSTASIQRFCHKFESSGFTEFKVRLKLLLKQTQDNQRQNQVDTGVYIDFLKRTEQSDYKESIDAAIKLLQNTELVLFIGVGSSNVIAEYGSLYFSSMFHMAVRIEDPVTYPMAYLSPTLLEKTCVVALSVSGETPEIINYLSNISFRNSHIISITNSADSTVARLSDVNIAYYINKESYRGQDVTSQLPCLFTLEKLSKILHEEAQTAQLSSSAAVTRLVFYRVSASYMSIPFTQKLMIKIWHVRNLSCSHNCNRNVIFWCPYFVALEHPYKSR